MKKLFLSLLMGQLAFAGSFAQGWEREISSPEITQFSSYFLSPDGGVFLAGYEMPPIYELNYLHLTENGEDDGKLSVFHDHFSEFITGNEKGEALITINSSSHQFVKLGPDGDSLWTVTDYPLGVCLYLESVCWKKDGGLFLFYGAFDPNWKMVLLSIDANGQTIFAKEIEASYWNGEENAISETADGGCSVAYTHPSDGVDKIAGYSPAGDLLWTKQYFGGDKVYALAANGEGTYGAKSFSSSTINKYSPTGDSLWSISAHMLLPNTAFIVRDIEIANDGNLMAAGLCIDVNTSTSYGFLAKLDKDNGAGIWVKLFQHPMSDGQKLVKTKNGGYLFGGYDVSNLYFYLYRTDADGNTLTNEISGQVFNDPDKDCAPQPVGKGRAGVTVIAEKGAKKFSATTDSTGRFAMRVEEGNYQVGFSTPFYYENCPFQQQVNLLPFDTARFEIGLKPTILCPFLEVSLASPVHRRCFDNNYFVVQYKNGGTAEASDTYVEVELDSNLTFVSSTHPATTLPGNNFRFNLGNLAPDVSGSFKIFFKVDCNTSFGQVLCSGARIFPDTFCIPNIQNRVAVANKFCMPVTGSFDPNDKQAIVGGFVGAGSALPDSTLEYLIRFQNTGSDTAFRIVVRDTISPLLDPSSVVPGAASHPYFFEISEGNTLRFTFDDILLPDSNVNEEASHGFVKFRAAQRPGNALDQYIDNRAAIYFDFNEPVLTNWARVYLDPDLVGTQIPTVPSPKIWPNPSPGPVQVELPPGGRPPFLWKLFDIDGRELNSGKAGQHRFSIDYSGRPSGIRILMVEDGAGWRGRVKVLFLE